LSGEAHSVKRHLRVDAEGYDVEIRRFIPHYDEMIATGVEVLAALPPADGHVLDLGGGSGTLSSAVLDGAAGRARHRARRRSANACRGLPAALALRGSSGFSGRELFGWRLRRRCTDWAAARSLSSSGGHAADRVGDKALVRIEPIYAPAHDRFRPQKRS